MHMVSPDLRPTAVPIRFPIVWWDDLLLIANEVAADVLAHGRQILPGFVQQAMVASRVFGEQTVPDTGNRASELALSTI